MKKPSTSIKSPRRGIENAHLQGEKYAAMTFTEIAKRLGIDKQAAWMRYRNAMRKIRRHPKAAKALQELVAFRNRECVRINYYEEMQEEETA